MKKTRLIFTALAVAFSLSSFQMKAAKSAVRKRFDASLDRVKKCFKGDCTRAEGLKAARDLSIAAAAVIVGGAIGGTLAGKGAGMVARRAGYPGAAESLETPYRYTGQQVGRAVAGVKKGLGRRTMQGFRPRHSRLEIDAPPVEPSMVPKMYRHPEAGSL